MAKAKKKSHKVLRENLKVLMEGRLKVFKAVKGLVRDGEFAEGLVRTERPDILALGIAPEDLKGLRYLRKRLNEKKKYTPDLSNIDIAYVDKLSDYGDVDAPPPCFTMALDVADELGIPVATLDLDNDVHTTIYVQNVTLSHLLRQSFRFRYMKKKRFGIKTPEEFVLTWDQLLNKAKGFRVVERSRELCMGETLKHLLEKNKGAKVLAIVELERADGVIAWAICPEDRKTVTTAKKGKKKAAKGTKE
jgi:hypothetical protein